MQDKAGSSAAAIAAYGGHVDCVARVLDSTAIAEERGMSALHLAVQVHCLYLNLLDGLVACLLSSWVLSLAPKDCSHLVETEI